MDLTKDNFNQSLRQILEQLEKADFVAIDFEFSGIKQRSNRTIIEQFADPNSTEGLPGLQTRYEEVKGAAEKYTILQAGFTIAQQCSERSGYVLYPYNANINPLVIHKMDIDRDITIMSSAAVFLQRNRFEMQQAFDNGVPYLSRDEHRRAIQLESERLDGMNIPDIDFTNADAASRQFAANVRLQLSAWEPMGKDPTTLVHSPRGPMVPLDTFSRRVVYQIVRNEFPQYVCVYNHPAVKVMLFDEKKELDHKRAKMDSFFSRLSRQIGFRWIIEAVSGGDLSDLSAIDVYLHDIEGWVDMDRLNSRLAATRDKLRGRRPVLVGHNLWTDLIYLYNTFIGPLPNKVADFAKELHRLFPMIVDTKYLATHHGNMDNSSLQELAGEYRRVQRPLTCIAATHTLYQDNVDRFHEAGYDSYLTAILFIKFAGRLAVSINWRDSPFLTGIAIAATAGVDAMALSSATGTDSSSPNDQNESSRARKRKAKEKAKEDLLIDLSSDDDDDEDGGARLSAAPAPQVRSLREISYRLKAVFQPIDISRSRASEKEPVRDAEKLLPKPVEPALADPGRWKPAEGELPKWLPAYDSDFWKVFGNRLRINGTIEGMLSLSQG